MSMGTKYARDTLRNDRKTPSYKAPIVYDPQLFIILRKGDVVYLRHDTGRTGIITGRSKQHRYGLYVQVQLPSQRCSYWPEDQVIRKEG